MDRLALAGWLLQRAHIARLALCIQTPGIAGGITAVAGAALLVQGATLWVMRRQKQA